MSSFSTNGHTLFGDIGPRPGSKEWKAIHRTRPGRIRRYSRGGIRPGGLGTSTNRPGQLEPLEPIDEGPFGGIGPRPGSNESMISGPTSDNYIILESRDGYYQKGMDIGGNTYRVPKHSDIGKQTVGRKGDDNDPGNSPKGQTRRVMPWIKVSGNRWMRDEANQIDPANQPRVYINVGSKNKPRYYRVRKVRS